MDRVSRFCVAMGFTVAACLGPGVSLVDAQQLKIENAYPRQLPRGQTTVVNVVVATLNDIQAAEIVPSQGVTVSRITREDSFQGALTWSSLTIEVAADATPGDRTLVLQLPAGRTIPTTVTIPPHVPRIADLRVRDVRSTPAAFDVDVAASDESADLGAAPPVWFMLSCGDMPLPGVVRGTVIRQGGGNLVRATVPGPPQVAGTRGEARCDVQVRVADAQGNESNTLSAKVGLSSGPQPAARAGEAPVIRGAADSPSAQEWTEITSQEERFTVTFPAAPSVADTAWFSQFGAVLPARVYSATRDESRFSVTVVDYNPVERLLVERSRACPPGANTCQGIADWGVGYWKTDVRGALLYAVSRFVQRDSKVTSLTWNGIALVQGVEIRLTNNADQSRTFASLYMHENRLVIVEATVPRGAPPPVAFNESLNWLDEQGRPVRYQTTYVNIPDVPRPLPRGAPAPPAVSPR